MVFVKSDILSSRLNYFKIPYLYYTFNVKRKMVNCIKLEFYSTYYEKVIILGHFNIEAENKVMKDFL